jgi:hypothetical protein
MYAELGIFVGENGRLAGPERVRRLQAMLCVRGADLACLHDERNQAGAKQ